MIFGDDGHFASETRKPKISQEGRHVAVFFEECMPFLVHSDSTTQRTVRVGDLLLIILTLLIAVYLINDHYYVPLTMSNQVFWRLGRFLDQLLRIRASVYLMCDQLRPIWQLLVPFTAFLALTASRLDV